MRRQPLASSDMGGGIGGQHGDICVSPRVSAAVYDVSALADRGPDQPFALRAIMHIDPYLVSHDNPQRG